MGRGKILRLISVFIIMSMAVFNLCPISNAASPINYPNFSDTSGLQFNNSATTDSLDGQQVIRLTNNTGNQIGSVFSTSTIPLSDSASFSTYFGFKITNPGGIYPGAADGIVFVINTDTNGGGQLGGGIGYGGTAYPHSIGVEFDTWNNNPDYGDIGLLLENHIAVDLDGNLNSPYATVTRSSIESINGANSGDYVFSNGNDFYVWIDYDGSSNTLSVRISRDNLRPANAVLTATNLNLSSHLNSNDAYVGFTASTGGAYENHYIKSWEFNNNYSPIGGATPVPYTATFKDWDGSTITSETVNEGSTPAAPAPTRTGYTLTGWNPSLGPITGDTTYTAQYTINTYTVTFRDWNETVNGPGAVLGTEQVNYGGTATAPTPAPSKTGYIFTGWDTPLSNITSDTTIR